MALDSLTIFEQVKRAWKDLEPLHLIFSKDTLKGALDDPNCVGDFRFAVEAAIDRCH